MSVSSSHSPRGISTELWVLRGRLRRETNPHSRRLLSWREAWEPRQHRAASWFPSTGQAIVARRQLAGDLAPGGGKLRTAHCYLALSARSVPFPLRLSRPRGVGPGFPPRASCAHCAFCAQGALWGPHICDSRFSGLPPNLPWAVTRTRCTWEVSFVNRL